jgi:protein SCO1/2
MKWVTARCFLISWIAQSAAAVNLRADTPTASRSALGTVYEARGILRRVDQASHQAVISHESIPGYMDAMTMSFDVADVAELRDLKTGDVLTFRLCVTAERAWIDRLNKTGASFLLPLTPPSSQPLHELSVGEVLPEFEFINQAGEKHRLRDYKGEALAITFIYTRCPLPTYCPLINRHFQTAQRLLERLSPNYKGRFLSISMDPQHDTPAILTSYAKGYEADKARWNFAVTTEETLRTVGDSIGLEIKRTGDQLDHNLRTVVIDSSGRLRHVFRGNTWTPQELAAEMRAALRNPL